MSDDTGVKDGHLARAPFTEEQVAALAHWQSRGDVHPLTCPKSDDHPAHDNILAPSFVGLTCPTCGFVQKWALRMMFESEPDGQ